MQVSAVMRHQVSNTSANLSAIVDDIANPAVTNVVLLASPAVPTDGFTSMDGPDSNLPLVAAYSVQKVKSTYILAAVFDGPFLTAVRSPRYGEVKVLLDEAVKSGKVQFYDGRAPFTAGLKPEDAFQALSTLGPLQALTDTTRPTYFRLLSNLSESGHSDL